MNKEETINAMLHIYSEEEDKYYPLHIEENNLIYKFDKETMTYIPLLEVDDEEPYTLGMWGRRRLEYLKTEKPGTYQTLMIRGLWEHLTTTDRAANDMEDRLMEEMSKAEGITEELKARNQMEWVGLRNNLKNRVREIIYKELIYT